MNAVSKLTSSKLDSIFTISHNDWTLIHTRVAMVSELKPIASYVTGTLPNYPDLVVVSDKWTQSTYPGIVKYANDLVQYTDTAISTFTSLQDSIKGLVETDPLNDAQKKQAKTALDGLDTSSNSLSLNFASLNKDIAAFSLQNSITDQKIKDLIRKFGPRWQTIASALTAVDNATGLIQGAWQAINDDLRTVNANHIDMSMTLLMSLDIQSALLAWAGVKSEASSFISQAT